jgi:pimeloyl-ACP methyl ester carboxylesterase
MRNNQKAGSRKLTRREIQVGQQTVYYQVAGQGEPLILIHGLSASSRWWVRNIDALAQHYQLYLIDLPGFGIMRHLHRRFALDEIASGLVLWMEATGISRADFLGHSMGGYICLWLAAHHPERVQHLVLVSPAGVPHIRSVPGYTLPLLRAIRYSRPSFYSILASDALRAGPLTILRAAQDLLTRDIRDCLKDISAPTLLIWGEDDALVPPVFGDILQQKIQGARLLMLKKAGHVSMFDQAEQFNSAVLSFLAGQTPGA